MTSPMPGYSRDYLANGRIIAYRFARTDRDAADLWFVEMRDLFLGWQENRPLHILIDLQRSAGIISAQALMRARQISHLRPDLPGRTAMLVGRGMVTQVMASLMRSGLAEGVRSRMMFAHEDAAIEWLLARDSTSTAEINAHRQD